MEENKGVEIQDIPVGEAMSEALQYVIDPDNWVEWFDDCLTRWTAKVLTCVDDKDAIRKINLGYHQLKVGNRAEAYREKIRLARRGRLVYIIPMVRPS